MVRLPLPVVLAVLLLHVPARAQDERMDAAAVLAAKDDTAKVLRLSDLCYGYRRINGDSALWFGRAALGLAQRLHYPRGEAQACNDLAIILIDRSGFAEADSLLATALRIRTALNDEAGMGAIYNKRGNVYQAQGRYEDALAANLEALRIFERIGPPAKEATILNNIAILQSNLRRYELALRTLERSAELRRSTNDEQGLMETRSSMANARLHLGDTAAAVGLYEETIAYFRAHKLGRELAIQLHNLGSVRAAQGKRTEALALYAEALAIRREVGEKKAIASTLIGLGGTEAGLGHVRQAKQLLQEGLALSTQVGARTEAMQAMLDLSRLYARAHMADSAIIFQDRYNAMKDSVFSADLNTRTAEMEARYRTEKQEREIQHQRADLAVRDQRIAELGARAVRRRFWLAVALGLTGLVIVSAVLLLQVQRRRARAAQDAALIAERERGLKALIANTDAERRRIAGELHDGVGQQLTGLRLRLEGLAVQLHDRSPQEAASMQDVLSIADDASRDVRGIAHRMMPRALGDLGLVPALNDMLHKAFARPGERCSFEHFGVEGRLPADVEVGVFRIAQELVNNVLKHAAARNIAVQLLRNKGHLVLLVEDDGGGMDPALAANGIGLLSIQDRVRVLRGTVEFNSAPGRGTVVTVRVPLQPATA